MNKQPLAFESVDKEGISHSQRVLSEIKELKGDNNSLRGQLDNSEAALERARELNKDLRGKIEGFSHGNYGDLALPKDSGKI